MKKFLVISLFLVFLGELQAEKINKTKQELSCTEINPRTNEKLCSQTFSTPNDKQAFIEIAISESRRLSRYRNFDVWGTDLQFEPLDRIHNFISKVSFKVGDDQFYTPLSSFADLTNVIKIVTYIKTDKFIIKIEGGGTSTHYFALLIFDYEGLLIERKISIPTFPSVGQKTVYSWNRIDDNL